MPVFRLPERHAFPDPELADESGLLAVGGDLSPGRVLLAYSLGIFPWYSKGEPLLWWSPDPRLILEPAELHVSRRLRRTLRRGELRVTADRAFEQVIASCARVRRRGQRGTWITDDMRVAYVQLHELGWAHSFEAWRGDELVGGLYGVGMGHAFFGESMFARESDASKVAFVRAVRALASWGVSLVDCQVDTEHLRSLGARLVPRSGFLARLDDALSVSVEPGSWTRRFDAEAPPASV